MVNLNDMKELISATHLQALPRDASPRHYFRGEKDGRSFILMYYPEASGDNRGELLNFITIGEILTKQSIKTPALYEIQEQQCLALFEDLGTDSFGACLRQGTVDEVTLYSLATDVLIQMRTINSDGSLPTYANSGIVENRRQLIDYYMRFQKRCILAPNVCDGYYATLEAIETSLPPCPQGFVHGDYHLENLMYVKDNDDRYVCGLIDYQDAMFGPLPYDLINLLEDARADISGEVYTKMMNLYCADMSADECEAFQKWFRFLAVQFHGRVLGLFIKLSVEQGRDKYLAHIPRLQKYILNSLKDPILQPLKQWFDKVGLDFEVRNDLDGDMLRSIFDNM